MSWDQLRAVVMRVANIYSSKFANDLIAEARDGHIITMLLDANTNIHYYELTTNPEINFDTSSQPVSTAYVPYIGE